MLPWWPWASKPRVVTHAEHPPDQLDISVVIPALDEERNISRAINSVIAGCWDRSLREVIVVDGGSSDNTVKAARRLGAKVLEGKRGRARQMNTGAAAATGNLLLFLHADSQLPHGYPGIVQDAMASSSSRPQAAWGCFESIKFDAAGSTYRVIEHGVRLRTSLFGMPYGDQALFVQRDTFKNVDGFRDIPLLEDVDLVSRLRKTGPMAIAKAPIATSARRYEVIGPWQTVALNFCVMSGWRIGIPVQTLAAVYHSTGIKRIFGRHHTK